MKLRVRMLILALALAPLPAPGLTISDDTFAETDWSATEVLDTSGSATFTTSQQLAGGNPDAYRQTTHSIPGAGQSIILSHVFSGAQHDPASSGVIESLDFSLDVRFVGGSEGTSQVGYQLVLVQDGNHYRAPLTAGAVALGEGNGVPGTWSSFSFPGLSAADFTRLLGSGPETPDFSRTGTPLSFGYLTQNTAIDTAIATSSGIDNWSVEIHVPEPGAAALMGCALIALLGFRRTG
jgi:hypothetical protein